VRSGLFTLVLNPDYDSDHYNTSTWKRGPGKIVPSYAAPTAALH